MTLTKCKVELKTSWIKPRVLAGFGLENDGADYNDNTVTIKDTKLYVPVVTLSAKDNQTLSKLLSKGFKKSVYLNE